MKIVLSFDDGRIDTYTKAFPVLKMYSLTASVHITTGFIDGTFSTNEFGVGMQPIAIDSLKEMHDFGIDVSSHGDKHILKAEDYNESKKKISHWLMSDSPIGISVPNSSASHEEILNFLKETNFVPAYVRVGRNKNCRSFVNKVRYVLYKLFRFQGSFNKFNENNLIYNLDKYLITSCVVKSHTKAKNIIDFIDKYHNENCCLVLMLHTICKKPRSEWEWQEDQFVTLCDYLSKMKNNKKIDIVNLTDLVTGE